MTQTVIYEQWITQPTEFSCAQCEALLGAIFPQGVGPMPPLHPHCHCYRQFYAVRHRDYAPDDPIPPWPDPEHPA